MTETTQIPRILATLSAPGCPDYAVISSAEGLKQAKEAFDVLLQRARDRLKDCEKVNPHAADARTLRSLLLIDEELDRLTLFIMNYDRTDGSKQTRALTRHVLPRAIALKSDIALSPKLYRILQAVRSRKDLRDEQQRSASLALRDAKRAGAALSPVLRRRLKAINRTLSKLEEKFANNEIDSLTAFSYTITDPKDLGDMPEQDQMIAAMEAKRRKSKGWVFTLSYPSAHAVMTYSPSRKIRKAFFDAQCRTATIGKHDNRKIIIAILRLRSEKAHILGYDTFASYVLEDRMAQSVAGARKLLLALRKPALRKARKELQALEKHSPLRALQRWDYTYARHNLLTKTHKIDQEVLRGYFPMEQTVDGFFAIARKLYGLHLKELTVRSYHPEVRTFAVERKGKIIGYLLVDLFTRPTKKPGAWCDILRGPLHHADGKHQVAVITCVMNFGKAHEGPLLLTHEEVDVLFHEFGHALHVLLCETQEPNLHSFLTEWDMVELPSQLMENWNENLSVLQSFAKHHETRKPLPKNLIKALRRSRTFSSGQETARQCDLALLDLMLHSSPAPKTVAQLDAMCLRHARASSLLPTPIHYRFHQNFSHIFSGGYSAGYYSYLWSQVLEADVFAVFEKEGLLNPRVGERFRKAVLSQGTKKPAKEMLRDFLGRDVTVKALLKKKGL